MSSTQTAAAGGAETATIDALLQHYLSLLDEYTRLRSDLGALQADVFQSLARANFSAERGVRYYGRDYYDERMQAARRLQISSRDPSSTAEKAVTVSAPVFGLRAYPAPVDSQTRSTNVEGDRGGGDGENREGEGAVPGDGEKRQEKQSADGDRAERGKKTDKRPTDPLRWFGILTPLALRQAQGQAVKAVEEIIPRLATVSAEMAAVELEVRRARKRRAKAEKAAEKESMDGDKGQSQGRQEDDEAQVVDGAENTVSI